MFLIKKNKVQVFDVFNNHGDTFEYTVEFENKMQKDDLYYPGTNIEAINPAFFNDRKWNSEDLMNEWIEGFVAVLKYLSIPYVII